MSDKPRLLLWSPLPPPAGGIATWTKRLLESELRDRYELRVVDVNAGSMSHDDRLGRIRLALGTLPRWARALREFRPDVVHINTSARWPGLIKDAMAVRLARLSGARTVLHVRGRGLQFLWEHPRWEVVFRRMINWADRLLVLNRVAAEHATRKGFTHVQQVPNFILRRPIPVREWPPFERPLRLLFVGWMISAKGIFELLDAVRATPGVRLTCVGRWIEGTEASARRQFHDKIDEYGLHDRVHIEGEVPLEQVWQHYERADVFVLPSWSEGFPNTLLESMMAGMPAIVSDAGAMPEAVVDGETGFVVPMRDTDALTAAIRRLATQPELVVRMGEAARARAEQEYERRRVVGLLADIYDELLGIDSSNGSGA
ncbi:MAG: glycosyltransferase [Myxococcota bacterium]